MGCFANLLKDAELTGWDGLEYMFAAIQVPEVEVTPVRSPNAPGSKATQRHAMKRPII
jgi:hypothetical protein